MKNVTELFDNYEVKGRAVYRNIQFSVVQDDLAINPFTEWDGNAPTMKFSNAGGFDDYSEGDINEFLANKITDGQLLYHQKELMVSLELDPEDYDDKEDKISDMRYTIGRTEHLKTLARIAEITKTNYLLTSSTGYSQGDWAELLIVATDAYFQTTGVDPKNVNQEFLNSYAELWGHWAWNRIYGFQIDELDDSCYGFYGDNHHENGLYDHVTSIIDYHILSMRKKKFMRLKELIKNAVPFIYRRKELTPYSI